MFEPLNFRKLLQVVILTLPFTVLATETETQAATVQADQSSISSTPSSSVIMRADQLSVEEKSNSFSIQGQISQSRNLIDFQDGTREDSTETVLLPAYSTKLGKFSAKIIYADNQTNSGDTLNGFQDTTLTYSYPSMDWDWKTPYILVLSPGFTLVAPTSRIAQKQTQLRTATIFSLSLGVRPDEILSTEHSWGFLLGLTAGRNFYAFEEDINGKVLNQYSSNQTIAISYAYSDWSAVIELINRSRLTFKNNVRQTFIANQELAYAVNKNLSVSIGHTNEASAMKANAIDSNLNFIDEKTSTVFATLGVSY